MNFFIMHRKIFSIDGVLKKYDIRLDDNIFVIVQVQAESLGSGLGEPYLA